MPVVELPRAETQDETRIAREREEPSERPERRPPPEREDREDVEIEVVRTFVEREDDQLRNWATIIAQTRTETAVPREDPDRDYWY